MVPAFAILNLLRRLRYVLLVVVALCLLTTLRLFIFQKDYNIKHIFYLSSYIKNFNWINEYPRNIPVHRYDYFNHHNKTLTSKKSSIVRDQLNKSLKKKKVQSSTVVSQKGHKMIRLDTENNALVVITKTPTFSNEKQQQITSHSTENDTQNVTKNPLTLASQKPYKVKIYSTENKAQNITSKAPTSASQNPHKVTSHRTEEKTQNVITKAPSSASQTPNKITSHSTENKVQTVTTIAPSSASQKPSIISSHSTESKTKNLSTKAPTPVIQKTHGFISHRSENKTQNVITEAQTLASRTTQKVTSHSTESKTKSLTTKAPTPVIQETHGVISHRLENKTQNVITEAQTLASQKLEEVTSHSTENKAKSVTTKETTPVIQKRDKITRENRNNKTQNVTTREPSSEILKLYSMTQNKTLKTLKSGSQKRQEIAKSKASNKARSVTARVSSTILKQRWKREIGLQKCKIPSFDALHPQILPYVNLEKEKAEKLKRYGKIVDGKLKLKLSNVQKAGFYYLRRFKDYNFKLSSWHDLMPNKSVSDIDVSFPLKEEFIRLDFTHNNENYTEYLSHVITNDLKYDVTKRQNDEELNIVMVMLDSQSHKNVERQLRKTYLYLTQNPYTVILNNHVITGDGTSSNLVPMFTGKYLTDLPEARGWINGSKYLDTWPFIFRDFQKKGYVTLLGDDDPRWGAFQFRLKGFNKQPTDKYLLPFQFATKSDEFPSYSHQYAFEYLKKFSKTYTSYKHFSFLSLGMLGHNYLDRIKRIDEDAYSLYTFFRNKKYRNNTAILFFGDHGHRYTKLRQMIWGKLEERLPFMSLTFPPWFFKKYKKKISFLKMNSHLLTSHFDIYQTLRHILFTDTYTKTRDIGESLFTNIKRLNRTCKDAGVPAHFCPCKEYRHVSINDTNVVKMCRHAVAYFNDLLGNITEAKQKCSKLELREILRARSIAPSETMQKHDGTYDTEKCDHCGLKSDKNFKMKVTQYEIVFTVEPSRGIFESLVEYLHDTGEILVHVDVSRVNRYGNDPECIAARYPHLRKYCLCKEKRKEKD